jgi:phage protein D
VSNILATKYRKGTSFNVAYPTLPVLTVQPRRIDIYQKQYHHDIVTLEYSAVSTLWFENLHTGVPITFAWTQDTITKYWTGYVSSVTKVDAPQTQTSMTVMAIGTSFVLKERATRTFKDSTITEAVQVIAEENGFKFIGDAHSVRFKQLLIPGMSYWLWINEQAKRIGYGVIVDGPNFMFRRIDKLIDQSFSVTPILSMGSKNIPFNTQFLDRTLDMLTVINGDNIEENTDFRTIKNVGGVDPTTSAVFLSSSSPDETGVNLRTNTAGVLFKEFRSDRVANTQVMADAEASGAAQNARFNLPAKATAQGDPRIRPFSTVYVSGTGDKTDGYWFVKEAHHMLHKIGDYMMDLTLATDGSEEVIETPFRSRGTSIIGTIDVGEALANNGTQNLYFELNEIKLVSKDLVLKSGDQTWANTNTYWTAVGGR